MWKCARWRTRKFNSKHTHQTKGTKYMALTKAISADVLDTLRQGKIDGDVYHLPPHRFSRERYTQLAEVINNAGGKWTRKVKGFTFKGTPEAFRRALGSGETVNVQQVTQFFPTPPDVARRMAGHLELRDKMRVLEPSAGHGALIDAVFYRAQNAGGKLELVQFVEKEESNCTALAESGLFAALNRHGALCPILQRDFLELIPPNPMMAYDAVIMNPPFTRGSDIKHILHAWDFLKRGGRLVALCANGPKQNEILRPFCESLGGTWEILPAGTFKDSGDKGTNIETVLMTANA